MNAIFSFIMAAVYLYDGTYHRRHMVNQTSYVCGTLWAATTVYELMNMPEVKNFIYTVSRLNRLVDSFIEEFQALDSSDKGFFAMIVIWLLTFSVLERDAWYHPASYINKEEDPDPEILFSYLFVLIAPLVMVLFMCDMWIRNNYAISAVLVLITVGFIIVAFKYIWQVAIINDRKNLI